MEKLCKRCDQTKPTTEFPKHRKTSDGLYTYCKKCSAEKTRSNLMKPPKRTPPDGLKWCGACKQDLPIDSFHLAAKTYDGRYNRCKKCSLERHDTWRKSNLPKAAKLGREWRKNNPERSRDHHLKKMYGLPYGSYDKMFAEQSGKCAICKNPEVRSKGRRYFSVDHCHETGEVRGLLCNQCNFGIGYLGHNIQFLLQAIEYLKRYQPKLLVKAEADSILAPNN